MKNFLLLFLFLFIFVGYSQNSAAVQDYPLFEACEGTRNPKECFQNEFKQLLFKYYQEPDIVVKENYKGLVYFVFEVNQQGVFQFIYVDAYHQEIEAALKSALQKLPQIKPAEQDETNVSFKQIIQMQIPFKSISQLQFENEVAAAPALPPAPAIIEAVEDETEVEEMTISVDESYIYEDVEIELEEEEFDEFLFSVVEDAPVFTGCEKEKTNEEIRACTTEKISQFLNTNFNNTLASELGLTGKIRVYVSFVIDPDGNVVNAEAKSAHPKLSQEGERVVGELPTMKPGKNRGKSVAVKYMLPIQVK